MPTAFPVLVLRTALPPMVSIDRGNPGRETFFFFFFNFLSLALDDLVTSRIQVGGHIGRIQVI